MKLMKDYPSTSHFPSEPKKLSREALESSYLEIRQNYKGLQLSRGQFAGKSKQLQSELELLNQAQDKLLAKLSQEANQKQELLEVVQELQKVSLRQKELVSQVREEFEFVRDDKGNIIQKFNRIMRIVFKFLNQDVSDAFRNEKVIESKEDWTDQSPRGIGKSEREW
jgi:hypothetical protein